MNQQVVTLPATAHISAMRMILKQMRYTRASLPLVENLEKHLDAIEAELRNKRGET